MALARGIPFYARSSDDFVRNFIRRKSLCGVSFLCAIRLVAYPRYAGKAAEFSPVSRGQGRLSPEVQAARSDFEMWAVHLAARVSRSVRVTIACGRSCAVWTSKVPFTRRLRSTKTPEDVGVSLRVKSTASRRGLNGR